MVVDVLRILLERVVDEQGTVPGTVDGLSVRENDAAGKKMGCIRIVLQEYRISH